MTERGAELSCWLSVVKGEYREMPGLQLTKPQVRRLWGLDPATCDALLETLEASRFLRITPDGCYVLFDSATDANAPCGAGAASKAAKG